MIISSCVYYCKSCYLPFVRWLYSVKKRKSFSWLCCVKSRTGNIHLLKICNYRSKRQITVEIPKKYYTFLKVITVIKTKIQYLCFVSSCFHTHGRSAGFRELLLKLLQGSRKVNLEAQRPLPVLPGALFNSFEWDVTKDSSPGNRHNSLRNTEILSHFITLNLVIFSGTILHPNTP